MSLAAIALTSLLLALAAWTALRRRYLPGLVLSVVSIVPLLVTSTTLKAVFVWVALIGLIALSVVIASGLRDPERTAPPSD